MNEESYFRITCVFFADGSCGKVMHITSHTVSSSQVPVVRRLWSTEPAASTRVRIETKPPPCEELELAAAQRHPC